MKAAGILTMSGGALTGTAAATEHVDNGDIDGEYGDVTGGTYIETPDGVPLYYTERGEGETIVLIHGWTCDSEYWWQKNVDALAENHHVVTYDLRGHGLSGKTDDGHTLSGYADDLDFLMGSLDIEDVTLVGWSMGVPIILTYLERCGNRRVRAIGLVDQTPKFYSEDGWEFALLGEFSEEGLAELVGGLESNRSETAKPIIQAFFAEPRSEERLAEMYARTTLTPTSVATAMLNDLVPKDFRDHLPRIDVPTLLLYGEHSAVFPGPLGEWMHEQIPDSDLVTFAESGHSPFWEEPEKFNTELAEFVARVTDTEPPVTN
ncbi:alpha/beta fold hydrolase [Halalkalicoccus ordinarius]|uniref:alpha/beta fold hydrolase n=1 Tax=Halalkalicoccus ordinarius TaxID=3116651 RepID=UPI00300E84AB